ncbi:MAG: LysR substrate-binding domain-containing protein [Bauldia sp.]
MTGVLDLDQLRTFAAIAETGSFTKAAERVNKTQSAVSMQMRRLEERVGKTIFERDGRQSRLTGDGERLLAYARRMLRLSDETLASFSDSELSGCVRLGTPDDYADRFLPEILARFARSNPRVEVTVDCQPSPILKEAIREGSLDLAIVTFRSDESRRGRIRQEPLYWVASAHHAIEHDDPLPLALGKPTCEWRQIAMNALAGAGKRSRVLYSSVSATATAAAVLAGLAVSICPESALRAGMRVLGDADGFPRLPPCDLGMIQSAVRLPTAPVEALAEHIVSSLDNLTVRAAAE